MFVTGNLYVLSIDSRIDCDNCAAITPSGQLILSLNKDKYQSLGLEGQVSHFHKRTQEKYSEYIMLSKSRISESKLKLS